jgi:hypothetical protein
MADVRVIQRREDLGFALEAGQPVGVVREQLREHFQRDIAIELGVARAVDLTHAAATKRGDDLIKTDMGTA